MSKRRRAWAFAAVVAGLVGSSVVIVATGSPPRTPGPSVPKGFVLSAQGEQLQLFAAREKWPGERFSKALPSARRQARRFLFAFLRYESRGAGAGVRASFAATADEDVRRFLGVAPRRASLRRERPWVVSLHLYGPRRGKLKASALLGHARERSLFEFVLSKHAGRWRVSELYP